MNPEFKMYARQMLFKEIGVKGQKKLKKAKVSIVGCGATGSLAAEIMVRSGVGNIKIIDRDIVEASNLQSQSLFRHKDIGKPKASAAGEALSEINPYVKIIPIVDDINAKNVHLIKSDIVLDCTDNIPARFLINEYCKKESIPWIYCGVAGSRGSVISFMPKKYCFECVFGSSASSEEQGTCRSSGALSQAVHTASAFQTAEAFKIILGKRPFMKIVHFDIWRGSIEYYKIKKNPGCGACNGNFLHLTKTGNSKKYLKKIEAKRLCGSEMFQIKCNFNFGKIKAGLSAEKDFADLKSAFRYKNITFFPGRALVKAKSESEAEKKFSKILKDINQQTTKKRR